MNRRVMAVALAAALVAAACSDSSVFDSLDRAQFEASTSTTSTGSTPSGPTSTRPGNLPQPSVSSIAKIKPQSCPGSLRGSAMSCGLAEVPLDPSDPTGRATTISFLVMEGSDSGFDTPVAVLQGGPGGASSDMAGWFPQREFTQIFIDQRGTGFGPVVFDCSELDELSIDLLAKPSDRALDRELKAYGDCASRFGQTSALAFTNTASLAADVESVMAGLEHDRWVVYGVSYGTTIGLELLRRSARGLVGAVLDGVYPPDLDVDKAIAFSADRSIGAIDSACAVDAGSRPLIDGVSATLDRLITELDADPIRVAAKDGVPETLIDGQRLAVFTFLMLYGDTEATYIPWMLAGLDRRDTDVASWTARIGSLIESSSAGATDEGTYFAVQCHDRAPFTTGPPESMSEFASVISSPPTSEVCDPWGFAGSASAEQGRPVESTIPTLLMAGGFDPITPADYARSAAKHLTNSVVVEQPGRGHGIWYGSDCIGDIVLSFVSDPGRSLDTSCAAEPASIDWSGP